MFSHTYDTGGLFEQGTNAPTSPGGATAKGGAADPKTPTERRDKLFLYDAAAVQALNPYGCSQFTDSASEEVWNMVIKGNNRAKFHSELASDDAWRIGVGISRTAETLLGRHPGAQGPSNMAKLLKSRALEAGIGRSRRVAAPLGSLELWQGLGEGQPAPAIWPA